MNEWFFNGDFGAAPTNFAALGLALLLAFACGQAVAWTYMFTHAGLSYSRSYVNTLIIMPVIVAAVMMILANNLVIAFGLMAIFAMVRFRSILRDTLDTAYVLAVIVIGLGCGTLKLTSAILGCLATLAIMFYFWATASGTRHRYDVILNLRWTRSPNELAELQSVLHRHSRSQQCSSQRAGEEAGIVNLSYRLLLRDPDRLQELVRELQALDGIASISTISASDESEL